MLEDENKNIFYENLSEFLLLAYRRYKMGLVHWKDVRRDYAINFWYLCLIYKEGEELWEMLDSANSYAELCMCVWDILL